MITPIQIEGLQLLLFSLYLGRFRDSSKRDLKSPHKQVFQLQVPRSTYSVLSVLLWPHLSTSATYDVAHSTAFQAEQLPVMRMPASGQGAVWPTCHTEPSRCAAHKHMGDVSPLPVTAALAARHSEPWLTDMLESSE